MVILMPVMMAYSLVSDKYHEYLGVLIFILFITHHIFNRKYIRNIVKGKYNVYRIGQLVINIILLILMFLQPISGILMSKYLFNLNVSNTASIRLIHLCAGYWLYVFLSIHAGMHLYILFKKVRKIMKKASWLFEALMVVVSIYGMRSIVSRNFMDYMFLGSQFVYFDYSSPLIYFFLDYLSIMVLFMYIGYILYKALKRL